MNVLIVDDDAAARALMRRVLVDFNVQVVEADDGVTGLERMLAEPIDLLLLDIKMRVMDGMRTLEAVRRSPKYATLRVVMMTGMADQERVARAMELGVTDFIVKPFTPATLRDRLVRILGPGANTGTQAQTLLDLKPSDRVIVVDQDAAFREFFAGAFTLCRVHQADSELSVLKQSENGPIAALFEGKLPGLLDRQSFLETLRGTPHGARVPVIGCVRSADRETARASGAYQGVIARTFEVSSLMRSLASLLTEPTRVRMLFGPTAPCMTALFEAMCTCLGGILRQPVTVAASDPPGGPSAGARWLVGTLPLRCGQTTWELRLHLPFAVALEAARTARDLSPDQISETHVLARVGELTLQFGTQLRDDLLNYGLECRLSPVRAARQSSGAATTSQDATVDTTRSLVLPSNELVGIVQLVRNAANAAPSRT